MNRISNNHPFVKLSDYVLKYYYDGKISLSDLDLILRNSKEHANEILYKKIANYNKKITYGFLGSYSF